MRPADKPQVKAAKVLPLVGLARPKQDPGLLISLSNLKSAVSLHGNTHMGFMAQEAGSRLEARLCIFACRPQRAGS